MWAWIKRREQFDTNGKVSFLRLELLEFHLTGGYLSECKSGASETNDGALATVLGVLGHIHSLFFDEFEDSPFRKGREGDRAQSDLSSVFSCWKAPTVVFGRWRSTGHLLCSVELDCPVIYMVAANPTEEIEVSMGSIGSFWSDHGGSKLHTICSEQPPENALAACQCKDQCLHSSRVIFRREM
ncbi:hypothetical protein CRG98_019660 [Punica granatum]|uniref:Uncharacterized protein n=1 Tax=Punica granatum TaxID=22663 RepID=A0A2I0JU99_PUNGR|nr:hypothetical protein CRG98_019660 [Punica granatum]